MIEKITLTFEPGFQEQFHDFSASEISGVTLVLSIWN